MDALLYLYKFQLILVIAILVMLLFLIFLPGRVFRKKIWGWGMLAITVVMLVVSLQVRSKPLEIPKSYSQVNLDTSISLARLASNQDFYIGVAVSNGELYGSKIPEQFNSITPDNATKWGRLINGNNLQDYNYSVADSIVDFAMANNLRIRGHVLTWGRAADFFKRPDLNTLLKGIPEEEMQDTLNALIKGNIDHVLGHFKGRILTWDCVNEPLEVFGGTWGRITSRIHLPGRMKPILRSHFF
jgi:endo-1,4-beta-xylanase